MKTQKEVFEKFQKLSLRVSGLGLYVQNDLERLLKDGHITKEDITKNITDSYIRYIKIRDELEKNYNDMQEILSYYSKSK